VAIWVQLNTVPLTELVKFNAVVLPEHMVVAPLKLITGVGFTVTTIGKGLPLQVAKEGVTV
jgi:hypothetical protein